MTGAANSAVNLHDWGWDFKIWRPTKKNGKFTLTKMITRRINKISMPKI